MKHELGGKIIAEFAILSSRKYSFLIVDDDGNKKAKSTKKCVIKRKFNLNINFRNFLEETQLEN